MNRVDPTKDVQSLMMLAAGPDDWLPICASFAPHAAELWMEAKTSLIFEDYDLVIGPGLYGLEFFLTQNGMFSPLSAMPVRNDTSVASMHTPTHAAAPVLDALECSRCERVLSTPPQRLRPNEPAEVQNPWGKTAEPSPDLVYMNHSSAMVDQAVPGLLLQPFPLCWHVESILQRSIETAQTTRRLPWNASRTEPAVTRQYGRQPTRQEQFQPFVKGFPVLPAYWLFEVHACDLLYHSVCNQQHDTEGSSSYQLI